MGQPSTNYPGENRTLLIAWSLSVMHASLPLNEKLLTNYVSRTSHSVVFLQSSTCMYQAQGTVPRICMNICTNSSFGIPYILQPFMQASTCLSGFEFPLYFILSYDWSSSWPNLSLMACFMDSKSRSVLWCVLHHLFGVARSAISRKGIF